MGHWLSPWEGGPGRLWTGAWQGALVSLASHSLNPCGSLPCAGLAFPPCLRLARASAPLHKPISGLLGSQLLELENGTPRVAWGRNALLSGRQRVARPVNFQQLLPSPAHYSDRGNPDTGKTLSVSPVWLNPSLSWTQHGVKQEPACGKNCLGRKW